MSSSGCDASKESPERPETRELTVDGDDVRYLYTGSDGDFQPVGELAQVPLAVRGATAMWKSAPNWTQAPDAKEYVADLLEASPGDEVTVRMRSRSWMQKASEAGRGAARRALEVVDRARDRAKWLGDTPWLWRIGDATPPLYILGSSPTVTIDGIGDLGPRVSEAFDAVDTVWLEADHEAMSARLIRRYGTSDISSERWASSLSTETLKVLKDRLGDRIPPTRMTQFEPWVILAELSADLPVTRDVPHGLPSERANLQAGLIPVRFDIAAKATDKRLRYLHAPRASYERLQDVLTFDTLDHVATHLETLRVRWNLFNEAYRQRDLERLKSNLVDPSVGLLPDSPGFGELQNQRASKWLDALRPAAEEGGAIAVIGVEEVVSEDGILQRFKDAGFRVELVN